MNGTINSIWNGMPPVLLVLITIGSLNACSSIDQVAQTGEGTVESRALPQMQRPMQPGMALKPRMPGQPPAQANIQLPAWPQKFEVQGPEVGSFSFAVTQAGPITIDVQALGAPLLVTLQSPGGQPITQQATGNLRMNHLVTPQDVQRNLFWTLQIRLAQPRSPQQGGQATGTVNVQHPPVDQAAVAGHQRAAQQQAAEQQVAAQQAATQAAAQIEQAVQQRKAQFEQQETSRRAALFAQIEPQLNQLRSRAGGAIRPRGLEGEEPSGSATPDEAAAPTVKAEEIATRGGDEIETPERHEVFSDAATNHAANVQFATSRIGFPATSCYAEPGHQFAQPVPRCGVDPGPSGRSVVHQRQ